CWIPGITALLRARYARRVPRLAVEVLGLHFPNPIGLAAGLDKDARYVRPLAALGFGWLELGTVTPQPQPGNAKPRLFRIAAQHALINRMGFNSDGLRTFVGNLARRAKPCLLGVNIGKNTTTPLEHARDDYVAALRAVYIHAAYVAVNISSPNTPGLRELQERERLGQFLQELKTEQAALARAHQLYVPLALKIAPDLSEEQFAFIAQAVLANGIDAVIATNTTLARPGLDKDLIAGESGGLSGRPLKALATRAVRALFRHLNGRVPIIGVGGIENADDAWERLVAGADLLQIYTALIYDGPRVVRQIVEGLAARVASSGADSLSAAVAAARVRAAPAKLQDTA
ncbi:MAG TPA: dihydroorotate dehydrogenase (quinone), partial [Burkholderiales bacterium]|nr:dihydroorotate dehydrogenase (quinone) [Burkholderiales bacterium]